MKIKNRFAFVRALATCLVLGVLTLAAPFHFAEPASRSNMPLPPIMAFAGNSSVPPNKNVEAEPAGPTEMCYKDPESWFPGSLQGGKLRIWLGNFEVPYRGVILLFRDVMFTFDVPCGTAHPNARWLRANFMLKFFLEGLTNSGAINSEELLHQFTHFDVDLRDDFEYGLTRHGFGSYVEVDLRYVGLVH